MRHVAARPVAATRGEEEKRTATMWGERDGRGGKYKVYNMEYTVQRATGGTVGIAAGVTDAKGRRRRHS